VIWREHRLLPHFLRTMFTSKGWDSRFRALWREIATCHSSLGAGFGERVDPVKDARFARAGEAGASLP